MYPLIYENNVSDHHIPAHSQFLPNRGYFLCKISSIQTIQIIHPLQHNFVTHENTLKVVIPLHRSIFLTSIEKKSSETKTKHPPLSLTLKLTT